MEIIPYRKIPPDAEVPLLHPDYRSTVLRAPKRPLIPLERTLSEITGPVFGHERVGLLDHDLTRQHEGELLGERIIVSGRVMDEGGRPLFRRRGLGKLGRSSSRVDFGRSGTSFVPCRALCKGGQEDLQVRYSSSRGEGDGIL